MKTIKILALMAVALPLALTSCSDDDDEEDDAVAVLTGTDNSKTLVKKVLDKNGDAYYSYTYNSDNQCTYIGYYDVDMWALSYSPFKLTCYYGDNNAYDNDEPLTCTATLNSQGLLSTFGYNYTYGDEDEETCTGSCSYNSNNQLTNITNHWVDSYVGTNGSRITYCVVMTYDLTWSDDNLTKVVETYKSAYDDESIEDAEGDEVIWTYTYGGKENITRQYLMAIEKNFAMDGIIDGLGFAGLLGVGPKSLPSKKVTEEYYNGTYYSSGTTSWSYTLNDNGTVATETVGGSYTYTYVYADAATRAAVEQPTPISSEKLDEIMRSKRAARHARHHNND